MLNQLSNGYNLLNILILSIKTIYAKSILIYNIMNLSFKTKLPWEEARKTNFVQKILSGEKIHSIREDKHNLWAAGKTIHFCIYPRTKDYQQFKVDTCKSTQTIIIKYENLIDP